MKHNTGRTLVQSRRSIVSVSMFSRLPIANKADIKDGNSSVQNVHAI